MQYIKHIIGLALIVVFTATTQVQAELVLHITSGVKKGIPIVVVPFQGSHLSQVIVEDLSRSGLFNLKNPSGPMNSLQMGQKIDAVQLKRSGADYVILGRAQNGLEVEVFHSATGNRALGFRIPPHPNTRRMAHKAADLIYKRLIGKPGAFDTKIAYVAVRGEAASRRFQLVVADADGHNPQPVATSTKPIMSPAWSPDGEQLAYVSFETGKSAIYVQNLRTGAKRLVSARDGINGAPAWSPDGQYLAMSLSENESPEIFVLSQQTGELRQLTRSSGIDTEPAWANSKTLLYTSDQGGSPQLYQISVNGGPPRRLTFKGPYNSAASISGNQVAMVNRVGQNYRIALMHAASKKTKILSKGPYDESPTIAPNGSMVMYATKSNGKDVLAITSTNGLATQMLSSPLEAVRDPAWSPMLK